MEDAFFSAVKCLQGAAALKTLFTQNFRMSKLAFNRVVLT